MSLMNICTQCKNKIATSSSLCNICIEQNNKEFEKCKTNPYYFATTYLTINGKPFTTILTEEEFNKQFKYLKNGIKNHSNFRYRARIRDELK